MGDLAHLQGYGPAAISSLDFIVPGPSGLGCVLERPRSRIDMYAISRQKRAKTAWQWRVNFRRRGKLHAKSFPDLKHGGKKKALAAALAWRDAGMARTSPLSLREFNAMRL